MNTAAKNPMDLQLASHHCRLLADPTRIGSTITIEAPLASDADLYAKGRVSRDTPDSDWRPRQ